MTASASEEARGRNERGVGAGGTVAVPGRAVAHVVLAMGVMFAADSAVAQTMTMDEILEELRRGAPEQPEGPPTNGDSDQATPGGNGGNSETAAPSPVPTPGPSQAPSSGPAQPPGLPSTMPAPPPSALDPSPADEAPSANPRPLTPVPAPVSPPTRAQPAPAPTPSPAPVPAPVPAPAPSRMASPGQPPTPPPSPTAPQPRRMPSIPQPKPDNRATRAQALAQYPWYIQHQIVTPPTPAVRGDIAARLGGAPAPAYPAPSGPQRYPSAAYEVPGGQGGYVYPIRGQQPPGYSPIQPQPLPRQVQPAEPSNPANNTLIVGPAASQVARAVAVSRGEEEENLGPLLQAVRAGILRHDAAFFGNREEEGFDINAEVQFRPFRFMVPIGAPRPIIGMSINTSGDTNQIYAGFSWQWEDVIIDNLFMGFSLGFSLHDGALTRFDPEDADQGKEFGLRLLFRESVEIGYRITPQHSVSLMLDHISNANIADANEGLDGLGIRYGYRF